MQRSSHDSKEYQLHIRYVVFGKYIFLSFFHFGLVARKTDMLHVKNKGADQPAHLSCLIRAFVIPSLESTCI